MELFVKVYFWIALIAFILKAITIAINDFPIVLPRGSYIFAFVISIPFIVWAFILVYT